jgi:hypothetical protein
MWRAILVVIKITDQHSASIMLWCNTVSADIHATPNNLLIV